MLIKEGNIKINNPSYYVKNIEYFNNLITK